jgi:hypothetical protein
MSGTDNDARSYIGVGGLVQRKYRSQHQSDFFLRVVEIGLR